MAHAGQRCSVASAPGKALLYGGFVITDVGADAVGQAVALTARACAAVHSPGLAPATPPPAAPSTHVQVQAPQLRQTLHMTFSMKDGAAWLLPTGTNRIVECAVLASLACTAALHLPLPPRLSLSVAADDCFYAEAGQGGKTGLGSSSAVCTAICAALLSHFGALSLPARSLRCGLFGAACNAIASDTSMEDLYDPRAEAFCLNGDLSRLHTVAQVAHCCAQRGVGSGFDVCTAVFGSVLYWRFPPARLLGIVDHLRETNSISLSAIQHLLENPLEIRATPLPLPRGFFLVMGDTGLGGSSTVELVGSVKAWKRELEDAGLLDDSCWPRLKKSNCLLADLFQTLCKADKTEHVQEVVKAISAEFRSMRTEFRSLAQRGNEPSIVEPPEQQQLIDATCCIDGVVAAGVPGAGGLDAVFCLCQGDEALQAVKSLWTEKGVRVLPVGEGGEGIAVAHTRLVP